MASRAFFRCRACGEPVVAGAYRCPVCAIDFPAGTPGAPAASSSPSSPEPGRPVRADEARPAAGARPDTGVPAHVIAARLDQALVEELVPPTPAAGQHVPPAPSALLDAPRGKVGGALDRIVPAASDPDGPLGAGPGARLDAVPERADVAADAALGLAPGRDRAPQKPSAPKAATQRAKVPAVREWTSRELVPFRRRRKKSTSLAVTLALALLVLGGIGAGTFLIGGSRVMNIGGTAGPTAAAPLTVRASDGWVDVPAGEGVMAVTASGPYRLRIDGVVYHVAGDEEVRVPMVQGTSLALRTAGEGTVAQVRPAGTD